ncbi:MAG: class I SAM-dependent RNA methyltransferase [Pseudomonadota bacterium]|nr:class I SAM-dependent RNA methyltransferase [Pseudomonadota bacterium]
MVKDSFAGIVRDLSTDGRGVVQAPDGQVVFVAGIWQGEEVEIERSRRGKSTSAELISVLQPSEARRAAECEYHREGSCGGCPWMFVDYPTQLEQKQARLSEVVERITGKAASCAMLGASQTLGYRNRAQFKSDGIKLGYVAQGTHEIVDVTHCPVLNVTNQGHLSVLRQSLPNSGWRSNKNRQWTTIDIDDERGTPLVNQRQAFRQGNSEQNEHLRAWLSSRLANLPRPNAVLELFCGSGNLTEVIAEQVDVPVIAIEGDEMSLDVLSARNLSKVKPVRVNLFSRHSIVDGMPNCQSGIGVVLDPPRDGLKERGALKPWFTRTEWVVYVSCDLATWERDAAFLQSCGLDLDEATGLDMFPQTPHIETLSVFTRRA